MKKLLIVLLGALALTACTKSVVVPEGPREVTYGFVAGKKPLPLGWSVANGPVDFVAFTGDQQRATHPLKNYKTIAFVGKTACSEPLYAELCKYVLQGGRLVISPDLGHNGDYGALCGMKIAAGGKLEIANPFAEKIGEDVLRLPNGDGEVWFVKDGNKADVMADVLARTAKLSRGRVYLTEKDSDDAGEDCWNVSVAYYPADGTVILRNLDPDKARGVDLHAWGDKNYFNLKPGECRTVKTLAMSKTPVWSARTTEKGVEVKVALDSPRVGTPREPNDDLEVFIQPARFNTPKHQWYYQFFGNVRTRSVKPYWWQSDKDYQRFLDWNVDYKVIKGVGYEITVTIPWKSLRQTAPLKGETWRISVARWRGAHSPEAEEARISHGEHHNPKTWASVTFPPLDAKTFALAEAEIAASIKDGREVVVKRWRKPGEKLPITVPIPKVHPSGEEMWFERMGQNADLKRLEEAAKSDRPPRTFLVGDSITVCISGPEFMNRLKRFDPINLGRNGDWIENMHWRITEGMFDKVKPQYLVMLIGTNNGAYSGADRAAGVEAALKTIQRLSPKTKVLLYGIFPRGKKWAKEGNEMREANRLYAKLADGKRVFYADIGGKFLEKDGETVRQNYFADGLHPNRMGCNVWLDSIVAELDKLETMKE